MIDNGSAKRLSSPLGYTVQCKYMYLVSGETDKVHRKNDYKMEDKT